MKSPRLRAMDLLACREHSRYELHEKLRQRGFSDAVCHETCDALVRDRLLCDQRFAAAFVRHKVEKGFGPIKIRVDLRQRGVDDALVDETISNVTNWVDGCFKAWQKKFNTNAAFGSQLYNKQYRFLLQRGYPEQVIHQVLKNEIDSNNS